MLRFEPLALSGERVFFSLADEARLPESLRWVLACVSSPLRSAQRDIL